MDATQFDALMRRATRAPRRSVLAGLLAAFVPGLLGKRDIAAAPGDYDSRGQRCSSASTCNSPCRTCDEGRCVYACNNATEVCNASATTCNRLDINKGCCVPR